MPACELLKPSSRALVIGGLGFIGGALSARLARAGAKVRVLDCLLEEGGGRLEHGDLPGIEVVRGDARDQALVEGLARGCDAVFNLAGRTGHLDSVRDPEGDLEHNLRGALSVIQACRKAAPEAPLVFASTRQVYGRAERLPVDETQPVRPLDPNGVHKAAAEQHHLIAAREGGLKTAVLRLTNVYGPRMRVMDDRQNFVGAWIGRLLRGEALVVYGDGTLRRDLLFVEDAVDALLAAAGSPACFGRPVNIGSGVPVSLAELAVTMTKLHSGARWRLAPMPVARLGIDIGDSWCDVTLAKNVLDWGARTELQEGLRRTFEFYRDHGELYSRARAVPGPVQESGVAAV